MINYPAGAGAVLTRVLEAGSGSNVVVFLHGVGARADRWRHNIPAVAAAGCRCIALDLPGHGFAQKGADFPYGVPGYADFVERFLDERKISNVDFVGTSLGAHIAATIACRRPAMARSLTMVGATGLFPLGAEACGGIATRIVDRGRSGIERKLKVVMCDDSSITDDVIDEEWAINNSPGSDDAFEKLSDYFRHKIDSDIVGERLASLSVPIPKLLVWGEEDRSVPLTIGRKAQELLGGIPLRIIPQTAHAPYAENPDAFNQILVEFLKSCGST
jgi:2-hydroxy-6-oxonona-2,4-dienedioate hydrolase